MKQAAVIAIFTILVVFDSVATGLAMSLPVLAILLHLIIAGIGYGTVKAFTEPQRKGRRTLAFFCGLLCLATPIFGCIAAAVLLHSLHGKPKQLEPEADFIIGNPRTASQRTPTRSTSVGEPLVYAFVHASASSSHHLAIPLLRHPLDRKAVTLLQRLRTLGDARIRLFARSALTSSVENRERTLDQLRRRTETTPHSAEAHRHLAEMLYSTAESGVFGDLQHQRLFTEAGENFAKSARIDPTDAAAIFGKGMTLIRQNALDEVPEWYGRLLALPDDADNRAPRLEAELFAASGNWKRTQRATKKIKIGNTSAGLLRFWGR